MEVIKYKRKGSEILPTVDEGVYRAMRTLGLEEDYESLSKLKKDTMINFRELARNIHPDTRKRWKQQTLQAIINAKDKLMNLTTLPMTLENMEMVLRLRYNVPTIKNETFISYDTVRG